jgi:hypothetical protein
MFTPHTLDRLTNVTDHRGSHWSPPECVFITESSGHDVATKISDLFADQGVRVNTVSEIKCMAAQGNGLTVEPRVCFATAYCQFSRLHEAQHDDDDGTDYEDIPAFVEP